MRDTVCKHALLDLSTYAGVHALDVAATIANLASELIRSRRMSPALLMQLQRFRTADMALTNRVTPDGHIIATRARGTFMGNRGGMMHRLDKTLGPRQWVGKAWITCRLSFKGRWREVMGPDSYTELFFLDEATSFAAGHRPCYECRRQDALSFAELWADQHICGNDGGISVGRAKAGDIDTVLHRERLTSRGLKATFSAYVGDLPTGAFVRWHEGAHLVIAGRLFRWSPEGYTASIEVAPDTMVEVLTPKSTLAVFAGGYDADVHESALKFM